MRMLLISVVLCGCGVATPPTDVKASTSQALTCGAEPIDDGNGLVTAAACPFEQQYQNIMAHGTRLAQPGEVTAAGSSIGVTATIVCGSWLLGTDSKGVTLFLSKTDGAVLSHGLVHGGFPTSSVPATVQLPLEAK